MKKLIIASGPVIINNKKQILLNQHGDTEFWKFIGGSAKSFEMGLKEIAKERAKDEMGVDIEILDDTPFIMHTLKEVEGNKIDVILVHYLSKLISDKIIPRDDIREWKWISIDDLDQESRGCGIGPNIIPALEHFKLI